MAVAGVYNSAFAEGANGFKFGPPPGLEKHKPLLHGNHGQTLPWQKKGKFDSGEYKKKWKEKHKQMAEKLAKELNLTKDQKNESKKLHEEARKKIKPIMEEFRKERKKLRELKRSNAPQDQIDKQMQKLKDLKDRAHEIHMDNLRKFEAILDPEQKAKFQEMKKRKEAILKQMKEKGKGWKKQYGPEGAPKPPMDLKKN